MAWGADKWLPACLWTAGPTKVAALHDPCSQWVPLGQIRKKVDTKALLKKGLKSTTVSMQLKNMTKAPLEP